ncbi:unnamed protein product [Clavelina lepadiformis]|uniref:C2H2-type domain-containing protein n=1 Tax=Clavelina lepadiformis TaxID=159417 RepID=A0ABP0G109_CLALP
MIKIFPSVSELSEPASTAIEECAICSRKFKGSPALHMHMSKSHKTEGATLQRVYFCPVKECIHGFDSDEPFFTLKGIKQHYKLVHGLENFKCGQCEKKFRSKHRRNIHEKDCGIKYVCSCNVAYTTKRGLQDHIKRQNHKLPESLKFILEPKHKLVKRVKSQSLKYQVPMAMKPELPKIWKKNRPVLAPKSRRIIVTSFKADQSNGTLVLVKPSSRSQVIKLVPETRTIGVQCSSGLIENDNVQKELVLITDKQNQGLISSNDHRNILTQTEQAGDDLSWFSIQDVERMMLESTATQTYNVDHPISDVTDSSLHHSKNNHQLAVNRTHISDLGFQEQDASSVFTHIETQTDLQINLSNVETQTVQQDNILPTLTMCDAEMSTLDILLNNTETQTDFLFSPWSDGELAHSYTQTPDTDLLAEILDAKTD